MYYVMSDIHGCYNQMESALNEWDSEKETLVVIGDLIDRGPDSLKVVNKLMDLKKEHGDKVVVLKGNHEDMLLAWLLESPRELLDYYYSETHTEMLISFLGKEMYSKLSRKQRATRVIRENKPELNFMRELPLYLETENVIFVHAGINLASENWKDNEKDMLWIRNEFIYSKLTPEKRVFFGHTPTPFMNEKNEDGSENYGIWVSEDNMKVCIDGGVSMGGQLNVLRVDKKGKITEKLAFK